MLGVFLAVLALAIGLASFGNVDLMTIGYQYFSPLLSRCSNVWTAASSEVSSKPL